MYSMKPRPATAKRQVQAKQGPGRPRKKLRQEDWNQQWIDAVESECCGLVRAWDSYEAAYVTYYADNAGAPNRPM